MCNYRAKFMTPMRELPENFPHQLNAARQKLPLKRLMEKRGRGPADKNWESFSKCPYCEGAHCAGVFSTPRGDRFKCHRTTCPSGTAGEMASWDESGFIAFEENITRKQANRKWFMEAKVFHRQFKLQKKNTQRLSVNSKYSLENTANEADSPYPDFLKLCSLSQSDGGILRASRGLSDEMIERSHFVTNDWSNLDILDRLAVRHEPWVLAKFGLFKKFDWGYKPSGQFYGFGVVV